MPSTDRKLELKAKTSVAQTGSQPFVYGKGLIRSYAWCPTPQIEKYIFLDFRFSPCSETCMYSFGYFPGVRLSFAYVSEHSEEFFIQPLKMDLTEGSET
jgi:hypothetical protein